MDLANHELLHYQEHAALFLAACLLWTGKGQTSQQLYPDTHQEG